MLKKYNANLNRSLLVQVLRLLLIAKNATVKAIRFQVLVMYVLQHAAKILRHYGLDS
ncbi:MAG: hypothetical protein ACJAS1_007043 [Oleiphilaceae bacterium]|jgi:hypothetical protein